MPYEKRRPELALSKKAKASNSSADSDEDDIPYPGPATATIDTNKENKKPPTKKWINGKKTISSPSATIPTAPTTDKPVHGSQKKGRGGGHNCPSKDAATTHQFSNRCLKQQHAGYCPSCNNLVSFRYGCHNHGWCKEDLSSTPLKDDELKGPEWTPDDLEARTTEARKRHG